LESVKKLRDVFLLLVTNLSLSSKKME